MRKKLFAILMSMTMIASFMPSMAFATAANDSNPTKVDPVDAKHSFRINTATTDNAAVKNVQKDHEDEIVEFTPATCTKEGSVTLKCYADANQELCTATKTIVVKPSHDWDTIKLSVEEYAKKMQAAKMAGYKNDAQVAGKIKELGDEYCYIEAPVCKECGAIDKTKSTITKKTASATTADCLGIPHEFPSDATQAADCKTTTKCVNCQKEVKKAAGKAGNHSFKNADGSIKDDVAPTSEKKLCGNVIEKTYTCTTCGETEKTYSSTPVCEVFKNPIEVVEGKTDHKLYKKGTMTVVADSTTGDLKPGFKKSENFDTYYESDTTVKKDDGNTYYAFTCNSCGHVVVTNDVKTNATAEHKHVWKKVTSEATCTDPGYEGSFCEGCGMYAEKSAVTEKDNYNGKTSDELDSTVGTVITSKPASHKLNVVKKDATCAVPAHYEISCSVCGDEYTGTSYVQFVADTNKAPLYMNPKTGAVSATPNYGDVELAYLDPAVKSHKFTKKVVLKEASCTVAELSGFKCDECGKIDVHNVTPTAGTILGHKAEKVNVKAATCGEAGQYNVKCATCGKYANKEKYDVKNASDWSAKSKDAFDFTGDPAVVGKNADCDFSKWVVVKDSTVFEEGVKELHCAKCGAVDKSKAPVAKKTVAKATVTLKAGKNRFTVKASAANATGYKVVYKRAGKKAITKVVDAENLSKTYTKLAKGKKYTVKVTAFASNGTDTVYGATTTKTVKTK